MEKSIHAEYEFVKTNGSEMNKNHVLTVCYNGSNSYVILNGIQQAKFKAMNNLKLSNPLVIGKTTEDFTAAGSKRTSLSGNIYDLAVDYLNLDLSKLMSIQRYLMKKIIFHQYKMFSLIKKSNYFNYFNTINFGKLFIVKKSRMSFKKSNN